MLDSEAASRQVSHGSLGSLDDVRVTSALPPKAHNGHRRMLKAINACPVRACAGREARPSGRTGGGQ